MKLSRILPLATFLAVTTSTMAAQEAAQAPAASASMPQDCAKMMKKSHGHGTPTKVASPKAGMMDCGAAASAPQGKKKTDFGHLHGR